MKYLIMCEGSNEKEIIDILLENDRLIYTEDDLLGLTTYHARQITKSAQVRTELNIYPYEVTVIRVGDKQNEKLVIPADYKDKVVEVMKYCTKPELEILLIISEGLLGTYEKVKSKVKPKDFAKQYIKLGRKRYDNSTAFYREYYGNDVELLIKAIEEYKRVRGSHAKDELFLADLLK